MDYDAERSIETNSCLVVLLDDWTDLQIGLAFLFGSALVNANSTVHTHFSTSDIHYGSYSLTRALSD